MASFEDEDEATGFGYGEAAGSARGDQDSDADSWDQDGAPDRGVTPDDFDTVRCGECRKFIFEDSVRCPYCGHLQLDDERERRKPAWLVITAIIVIIAFVCTFVTGFVEVISWLHQ